MPTARELRGRGHSYRGFAPSDFLSMIQLETEEQGPVDGLQVARSVLKFVESGRMYEFLENTSAMFDRLDRDEQETFTRRNPDVVQWVDVYNRTQELKPLDRWFDLASRTLADDRSRAVLSNVPSFDEQRLSGSELLNDMATRRRSYRNWTPREIRDVSSEPHDLSLGQLDAFDIFSPEARADVDPPVEVRGRTVGRNVLSRVEGGRFTPVAKSGHAFFAPLDPDERKQFALRNPGLLEWISLYGFTNHLIHEDQLLTLTDIDYPVL